MYEGGLMITGAAMYIRERERETMKSATMYAQERGTMTSTVM